MIFFLLLFLKICAIASCIKFKLKYIGYYLAGNLVLDLVAKIVNDLNTYPKPYTGIGFIMFGVTTFCYLSNAAWLLFCAGRSLDNKTLQQVAPLSIISIFTAIMLSYPVLSGPSLLAVFYAYYGALMLTSFASLAYNLTKITVNQTLLLMMSLGGIAEILLVVIFGYQYYWLVNLCNGIFYLVILLSCSLIPKYANLLKTRT